MHFVLITSFDIHHSSSKWCGNLSLPRRKTEAQRGSVQFSHSVVSNSLQPRGLQHARSPCPSPTPGVYSNSCPLSWWCHPTISSSVIPFSFCLQSSQHHGLFKRVSSSHQVTKVLEFQLQHQPSNEHSGLISFRMDCKEIQPVHSKGDQSWIFIGGLMLKLKLQYFGHLMWRTDSLEKTPMLGKIEGRRRRGQQRMRSTERG